MADRLPVLHSTTRTRLLLGFAVIYVVWGSTYLAIRIGLATLPPFFMGAVRFLVAGTAMYAWSSWRGALKSTAHEWKRAAIVGFLLLFVGNGAVSWAEQRVSSGMTSLLVATVPLWLVLCEWVRGKQPRASELFGVAIGLVGVGLLVLPTAGDGATPAVNSAGAIVLTISALSWTIGSLYSRAVSTVTPLTPATRAIAMQMLTGGALLGLLSVATDELHQLRGATISLSSLLALLYLMVFGSLIGFSTYMWLLRVASPTAVATYAYVNPVVAVLLGVLVAGERLPPQAVLAMVVIVGGVVMVSLTPQLARTFRKNADG